MGIRSDVAFVVCEEDFDAVKEAFQEQFPRSRLLDQFRLIKRREEKGEIWLLFVGRRMRWYTNRPDVAFLRSGLMTKRTQYAEACQDGYWESWNSTYLKDRVSIETLPQLVFNI